MSDDSDWEGDSEEDNSDVENEPSPSPPAKKARTAQGAGRRASGGGGLTKKDLDAKLKAATEEELKELVRDLQAQHPDVMNPVLQQFQPRRLPAKPNKDDALLSCCFHCRDDDVSKLTALHKSEPVKICHCCRESLFGKYGTFTRDKVMEYFGFTKAEADKIPCKQAACGLWKNQMCYVYKLETVLKAVKAKHGSVYNMVAGSGK